jgi:benzodiazapine receptor
MSRTAAAGGSRWKPLALAALAAVIVMGLGALMTDLGPWSQGLRAPAWKPPDWSFGPIWTVIFALWAMAASIAWREAPDRIRWQWAAVSLALNGFLNVLWSALFFRLRHPDWALVEVAFLWLSIVLVITALARCSRLAAVLMLPYLLWVSVAAVLNAAIVRLNAPFY